jgi:hypothetical protein
MYFDTNPLTIIAESYGLNIQKDVLDVTRGDHSVSYEETRRFHLKHIVIVLYRMASGRYEAVHYKRHLG